MQQIIDNKSQCSVAILALFFAQTYKAAYIVEQAVYLVYRTDIEKNMTIFGWCFNLLQNYIIMCIP